MAAKLTADFELQKTEFENQLSNVVTKHEELETQNSENLEKITAMTKENSNLQKQLDEEIKFRGLNSIPGEGKHPIGDWPGESSFLIFDLSLESAKTLGRKFNQNAVVWCNQDAIPQLILLR